VGLLARFAYKECSAVRFEKTEVSETPVLEWLNYHHLLYFWAVARYGSVVRASEELRLAQPTISGQIRRLEDVLGEKLFDRVGRKLVLTDTGRTVFRYADEIFSLGQDLMGTLKGRASARTLRLTVGVADVLPKVMVQRLLEPAFHIGRPVQLFCREDRVVEDFLGALVGQELDLVLTNVGRTVFRYADEIFSLGQDLIGTLKGRASTRPLQLTVGVADALPKALVQKLLEPAFHIDKPVHLVCREDRVVEDFMSQLAGQELDLVLADRPIGPGMRANAFNHRLGECGDDLPGEPQGRGPAAPRVSALAGQGRLSAPGPTRDRAARSRSVVRERARASDVGGRVR